MPRRIHVPQISPGPLELDARNSHYLRDVLRLKPGTEIQLFDNTGQVASAHLIHVERDKVIAQVDPPGTKSQNSWQWTIASAVPKGNRADWMVEKLSEFGAIRWIPLQTARSVVHPEGTGKTDRWQRIAEESAKQCRRSGVMQIHELTPLSNVLQQCAIPPNIGFCLQPDGIAISEAFSTLGRQRHPIFLIGPEGGWTDEELNQMESANIQQFALASTILRIETAAIAVAAIVQSRTLSLP